MESSYRQNWHLNSYEERKNFIRLLHLLQQENLHSEVLELWESVNKGLWELCYWNDYFKCTNLALQSAHILDNLPMKSLILREIGWSYMEWEDFDQAKVYMTKSLQIAMSIDDFYNQCNSMRYLGILLYRKRELEEAFKFYEKALKIIQDNRQITKAHRVEWDYQEASIHNLLGSIYIKLEDLKNSQIELKIAISQFQALGEVYRYYQIPPLLNLGKLFFVQQNYLESKKCYREAYQISKELYRKDTIAASLVRLAQVFYEEKEYQQTLDLLDQALEFCGDEMISLRDKIYQFKDTITVDYTAKLFH